MKASFHSKQDNPNRVVVSIAVVQSELFWVCSVIFCLLRESRLISEKPKITITRTRAYSSPSKSPRQFKEEEFVKLIEGGDNEINPIKRRSSLPTDAVGFRLRPSMQDELVGNTCPPVWWQKTRVKLGHSAIHGDPKPTKVVSNTLTPSTSTLSAGVSSPIFTPNYTESQKLPTMSPSMADSKYLLSLAPVSTRTSVQSCSSAESGSLNEKQSAKKKLMSKLNAALQSHYHRRKRSMELKSL